MTETPSESSFRESVELSEDEFRDVYSLLKMCLAVEMGIDEKSLVDDGELVASCERILNTGREDSQRASDMKRGFVPLFERLNEAGRAPVTTGTGRVYRIDFT